MADKNDVVLAAVKVIDNSSSYSKLFNENFNVDGSPSSYDLESIFNNPQDNIESIIGYSKYCYRKHGVIMRVINIIRDFGAEGLKISYPNANTSLKKVKSVIEKYNEQIAVNDLVSQMIFELALTGNLACYDRDGKRVDIYPINKIKVVPLLKNNKQIIAYDTSDFDVLVDDYGNDINKAIERAYPEEVLEVMNGGKGTQYAILNPDNAYFAKINSSAYEPYGISVILPAFEDLSHKTLLKEAEKSTASDIINKILQVKVGDADNPPNAAVIREYNSLFANKSGSLLATTPYYVDIQWIEPETDIFGEDKFVEIDKDILNTLGVSLTLIRGEGGGNYAEGTLNFTGLVKTINGIRKKIPPILEDLYRKELIRNGLNVEYAPTVSFDEVQIDSAAKTDLLMSLFQNAGLPYRALYEGCNMDYDYIKLLREDENNDNIDETFKLHSMPFQGGFSGEQNMNDPNNEGGAPEKNLTERKSDKTSSNNDAPRTGMTNTNRTLNKNTK